MRPSVQSNVIHRQEQQKHGHDQRAKERSFNPGDPVYVRNFGQGTTWMQGTIVQARGPVAYTVSLEDGRVVRRHLDHIRDREVSNRVPDNSTTPNWDDTLPATLPVPDSADEAGNDQDSDGEIVTESSQTQVRRSNRIRREPDRFSK